MKVLLEPVQSDHDSDIHLVGASDLLIDGIVYRISEGVVWPEVYKVTNFAILDIKLEGGEKVVRLTNQRKLAVPEKDKKDITPTATTKDLLVETIDVTGLPVVVIQGKTQAEIDEATKVSEIATLKAQLATLDTEVSRSAENMYKQGIYTSISDREKDAIAQKELLRTQIATLS